jgi:hypothetical protein
MRHLIESGSVASRGGSVLHVLLIIISLVIILGLAAAVVTASGWVVENMLPWMWLSGATGLGLLLCGYIVGVAWIMLIGGWLVGVPIAIYVIAGLFG